MVVSAPFLFQSAKAFELCREEEKGIMVHMGMVWQGNRPGPGQLDWC